MSRQPTIKEGMHERRVRLFYALFSLVATIILLGSGDGAWEHFWTVWMAVLTVYWAYEFVRIHRAIRSIKASPFYYLMLLQDEFGGAR